MSSLALIIDDEPDIQELLDITMKRMGIDCHTAENLAQARELLGKYEFNICLTDMRLPDGDGVEFVNEVQGLYPNLPIAVITAHGSMDSAIMALKSGAFDFLTKPVDLSLLRTLVQDALKLSEQHGQSKQTIIGDSPTIKELRNIIKKVSRSQAPIFICGESGTGKELVARMIHEIGPRSKKQFVAVNCGAIPHDLLESELFGHVKGSFTGAISDKEGLFKVADGGTMFFDEVAELPQHMQVKLLRAIQEKSIRPVGADKEINVDTRILSATNRDLQQLVDDGQFRQDLYYRINVIAIDIAPLRERKADIAILAKHILEKISKKESTVCPEISESALNRLKEYSFPGNVRELENIIERALAMSSGSLIGEDELNIESLLNNNKQQKDKNSDDLDSVLVEVERQQILEALEKTRWNKTAAAKLLGISFRALRYRLEKLGIS